MDVLEYITQYSSLAEYESVKDTLEAPHVALTLDNGKVYFIPTPPHDYSKDYLTIVAKEDGTITFTYPSIDDAEISGYPFTSISYSVNGSDWVTSEYNPQEGNVIEVSVSSGDKVRWKGINHVMCIFDGEFPRYFALFGSDCLVDVEGNIMSLLFGDEFIGETSLEGREGAFGPLFITNESMGWESRVVSAENLILPATTLAPFCYAYMFYGCTSLTTAPELPATTLDVACYLVMFQDCISLTTAPQLPATTLSYGCYAAMFYGCTSLTTAPQLSATTLADGCYGRMFAGCTSLNHIECLATDISAEECTFEWVDGVADNGTFVRNADMFDWEIDSVNGIPSGWEIEPPFNNKLTAQYYIIDAQRDMTQLYNYYDEPGDEKYWIRGVDIFSKVEIDGTEVSVEDLDSNGGGYYLNDGTHTVVFTLKDSTTVHERLFQECGKLISVDIPSNVTYIGDYAFVDCTSLTSVTIPNSVTSIGDGAFDDCTHLTSIEIPNSVISIGDRAFDSCYSLTSIDIPNGVTSIGKSAFYECNSLTSVTIPSGVTSIGSNAFQGCIGLTSVTIPDSVTEIGSRAFDNCQALTSVTLGNGVTSIGGGAFLDCNSLLSLTIPNSVISIGNGAFESCTSLTSIDIPNSVTRINEYTFQDCDALTSITIPNSVTYIGGGAFTDCENLANIDIPSSVTYIGGGAFGSSPWWRSYSADIHNQYGNIVYINDVAYKAVSNSITEVEFRSGTVSIGGYAFYDCDALTSITIPNSVTYIGGGAFTDCENLANIDIPSSVTYIGGGAFDYSPWWESYSADTSNQYGNIVYINDIAYMAVSDSVTEVEFKSGTVSIGGMAFYNCSSLTSVTIPSSITYIGDGAFQEMYNLISVTFESATPPILGDGVFEYTHNPIYVPCESLDDYKNAMGWQGYSSRIVCYSDSVIFYAADSKLKISSNDFSGVNGENLTIVSHTYDYFGVITFNAAVGSIGESALSNIVDLGGFILPNSVTNIGNGVFQNCTNLRSASIGNSITTIGEYAFNNCSNLININIPNSVTSIGYHAFCDCNNLRGEIQDKIYEINPDAFCGAQEL